jgi:PAS domain S-box-containing protein
VSINPRRKAPRKTAAGFPHGEQPTLQLIYDTAPIGLAFLSPDCRYLLINQHLTGICGISVEDHLGRTVRECVPALADAVESIVSSIMKNGEPVLGIEVAGQIDERSWVTYWHPMRSPTGEIVGVNVAAEEITERKRAEAALAAQDQALRESELRFRELADNMSQFAWTADASGSIYWYNKRWHDYAGTTLEAMQGWGWQKVHHPDHVDRVVERIRQSFETGTPWEDTFPLRGKDGDYRWFLSRALPIRNEAGEVIRWFGTNTDVTEQIEAENALQARTRELAASLDELRAAQDRLVQTEKLASLGQLTAGIAHEIENPLNFVNNFAALSAELIGELNDTLGPAALAGKAREEIEELTGLLKDNLDKIVQHGKRADSIVKNMLLHSREGSGEHRAADINALLDESLNLAYRGTRAGKPSFNVTLQRDFDPDAGMIKVFPQEITRVLLNLLSNGFYALARRKSESGDSGFHPVLGAATRNLGDAVEIRIRDNGTGIAPEVRDKIFNPFFTTKPSGEGTGLGLSMSHDIIVKQHGGQIDVETEPGVFTEFRIVLPRR